ncbi:hypothetical protein [Cytobacillus sp. FSL R7-0680]|uniref:hypothetical protein n=1 Tax=Cytobacillus sp. FSL R7-0680 TaxID=2921689 RepID=UPI0030F6B653
MGLFSNFKKELSAINQQFKEDIKKTNEQFKEDIKMGKKQLEEDINSNNQFKEGFKKTNEQFKEDIKKKNNQFKEELKTNNEQLKEEFKTNNEQLKEEFKTVKTQISSDINEMKRQIKEREKEARIPKVKIETINGDQELGYDSYTMEMIQADTGKVRFKVKKEIKDDIFNLIKIDRTENIQKSALDVAGWTFAGSMLWGNAGALAGGLASQKGKDKSTAALFLVNEDTQKKIMLIIKCDSKILEKLSQFTLTQEEDQQSQPQTTDKYMQLERISQLKTKGILTQEEFQKEKEKILNS